MSEEGKKSLKDLAAKVREKNQPSGEPILNARGLSFVEELAKELTGPDAIPGLRLFRDKPEKFRLQRDKKNAEISVEWVRPIGAMVMTSIASGHVKDAQNYVWDEVQLRWRRLDGLGEAWADLTSTIVELLFPEAK